MQDKRVALPNCMHTQTGSIHGSLIVGISKYLQDRRVALPNCMHTQTGSIHGSLIVGISKYLLTELSGQQHV